MIPSHRSDSPRYIAVEGVIGAGKTTLATMLAEHYGARLVLEHFEENPFLGEFYREPARYAFQTQIFFLLSRFRQQEEFRQLDLFYNNVVSDYLFEKDRIFAALTLEENEMSLYDSVMGAIEASVPKPDLVVFLQSSLARLMHNIRKRGREMEQAITFKYLRDLSEAYTQFFFHYTAAPVLIVDTENFDFVDDRTALEELIKEIERPSDAQVRFYHRSRSEESPAFPG